MKGFLMSAAGGRRKEASDEEFYSYIKDLVYHPAVLRMKDYPHHGTTSCYQHCLNVAYYNYRICTFLGLDAKSASRAGMVHDLFLYDWHEHAARTGNHFHGLSHPKAALRNAKKYFVINDLEEEIILKHMWPLTVIPPLRKEAFVICFTDKYCGAFETADREIIRRFCKRYPLFMKLLKKIFGKGYQYRDYRLSSVKAAQGESFVSLRRRPGEKWRGGRQARRR